MKIIAITCYPDPDYIRAWTIRHGLQSLPNVEVIVVKNTSKGVRRYLEVIRGIWAARKQKPDAYVLTFRGYELLPFILLFAGRKPVILDELINPVLVVNEHRQHKHGLQKILMGMVTWFGGIYYSLVRRCRFVIADTSAHASYSKQNAHLKDNQVFVLPVSTNEELFKPLENIHPDPNFFTIFYYGTMQPLHGLEYIFEAAIQLAGDKQIRFHIAGGKDEVAKAIEAARQKGAQIDYDTWIDFAKLPEVMGEADLFLGGPFGPGEQAGNVITGKTFQSLAMARPTLLGRNQVIEQEFSDKQNCLLVERASSEALVTAIIWAKDHPTELATIRRGGYELYWEKFSSRTVSQLLGQMVAQLSVANDPARAS